MKKCSVSLTAVLSLAMMICMSAAAFADESAGWKPTENQDKFSGMEYDLGMLSAAAKGTEIVVNNDGTVTLNVTTKPMVSTRYAKIAVSKEELTDDDKMEQAASAVQVTVGTAEDEYINPFSHENEGVKTYYWSVFSYTMPAGDLMKPIYIAGFNTVTKNDEGIYVLNEGRWAYSSYWKILATPELTASVIGAAKADLTNKELVEASLAVYNELTEEDKAAFAEDIQALEDARAEIERKEKEAAEIDKVKKTKISKFKAAAGKRKVTFTWKKNSEFAGYELKYKVGSKSKTLKITKASIVKKVVKKLKKGKKVSAQIRGYKTIAGTKYTGPWVKSKTVKVK